MSNDEWFEVEHDGSGGMGPSLAGILRGYASILEKAPEIKRYDFQLVVEERDIDE